MSDPHGGTPPGGPPLSDAGASDGPEVLNAYFDGLLTGAALAAFEGRLAADARLRGEVELQRRINASLARSFAAAGASPVTAGAVRTAEPGLATAQTPGRAAGQTGQVNGELQRPARAARAGAPAAAGTMAESRMLLARHAKWVAMAASLLLAAVVFAAAYMMGQSKPDVSVDAPFLELSVPYVKALDRNFTPEHPWNDGRNGAQNGDRSGDNASAEFIAQLQNQLGQRVQIAAPGPGVRILGWSPSTTPVLSPDTVALFARTADGPVVVIIDRLSTDRELNLARGSRLVKHRREVGSLVVYEVGTAEKPVLAGLFRAE